MNNYISKLLPPEGTTWDKIQLGDTVLVTEKIINPMTHADGVTIVNIEEEVIVPVTLSNPDLYYKYKPSVTNTPVTKINSQPRDLRPSSINFEANGLNYNIFDLDSVRLRYSVENGSYFNPADESLAQKFAAYLGVDLNTPEGKAIVIAGLNQWTQRNLSLLDNGVVMQPIVGDNINFHDYFNGDKFNDIFTDVKDHYMNTGVAIQNYRFDPVELIMGDIYQSNFKRNDNDSIYKIKKQGYKYFSNYLIKDYDADDTEADIKLNVSGNDPVYIRYVDELPGFDSTINLKAKSFVGDNGETEYKHVRYNQRGEEIYTLPNTKNIRVITENDKEIILIKAAVKNVVDEKETWDKVKEFNYELSELIRSFKGSISSFVPLMNGKLSGPLNSTKINEETKKLENSVSSIL